MTIHRLLMATIVVEIAAAATAVVGRLNSTAPIPPLVVQYTDALTGNELLALPRQFLFDSASKWRRLADSYAVFGFFAKADACFRLAAVADPQSTEIAYRRGYCLVRLGRLDEAFEAFRRVIDQSDPQWAHRAWYHLGAIQLRREMPAEALAAFAQAGDAHLPSVYQRAKLLVRADRLDEAAPLVGLLAEALPRDVLVWRLRAQVASLSKQPKDLLQARDALEQADSYLELDDKGELFDALRDRFGLDREFAKAREQQRTGHSMAAAAAIARLARPETRWDNAYLFFLQDAAMIQLKAGNVAAVREFMDRQIDVEQFPTPTAWRLRGAVYFIEQNWAQALEAWSRAERMAPQTVDQIKMATVVEQLGDDSAAQKHVALAGVYSGINLFREGKLAEARAAFRRSAAIDPEIEDLWFYLGECERRTGNDRPAEAAYRRCLKRNPGHGRALVRLQQAGNGP